MTICADMSILWSFVTEWTAVGKMEKRNPWFLFLEFKNGKKVLIFAIFIFTTVYL